MDVAISAGSSEGVAILARPSVDVHITAGRSVGGAILDW